VAVGDVEVRGVRVFTIDFGVDGLFLLVEDFADGLERLLPLDGADFVLGFTRFEGVFKHFFAFGDAFVAGELHG